MNVEDTLIDLKSGFMDTSRWYIPAPLTSLHVSCTDVSLIKDAVTLGLESREEGAVVEAAVVVSDETEVVYDVDRTVAEVVVCSEVEVVVTGSLPPFINVLISPCPPVERKE